MRISIIVALLLAAAPIAYGQECPDEEFCPDDCWNDDVGGDVCATDVPEPCVPGPDPLFEFIDDEGADDGQLMALNREGDYEDCGTLTVEQTGYYSIFDSELSESCDDQLDETGYLTITNSCNTEGWPTVRNAERRFLVLDTDNSGDCDVDSSLCSADEVCRNNGHGFCCVPSEPVYMGTFLLVADQPNRICLHHWCPEWAQNPDLGFVNANCDGDGKINSIHFLVDANALACEETETLQECSFGCFSGECAPDPCDAAGCPLYCKDGTCLDESPCAGLDCPYGCKNGYCLQDQDAPGLDGDGDGYGFLSDCDDTEADVFPGQMEVCANGIDDNCDGVIDESSCSDGSAGGDAGIGKDPAGEPQAGCGCRASASGGGFWGLVAFVLFGLRRRSRAST